MVQTQNSKEDESNGCTCEVKGVAWGEAPLKHMMGQLRELNVELTSDMAVLGLERTLSS